MNNYHRRAFSVNQIGVCAKAAYEQCMIDLGKHPEEGSSWESIHEDTRIRWRRNAAAALKAAGYCVPRLDEPSMPSAQGN